MNTTNESNPLHQQAATLLHYASQSGLIVSFDSKVLEMNTLPKIEVRYDGVPEDAWQEGTFALHPDCFPEGLPIEFVSIDDDCMGVRFRVSDPGFLKELEAMLQK